VRAILDHGLAIVAALLPRRYWESIDLPVAQMVPVSAALTFFGGFAIGIPGYLKFNERLMADLKLEFIPPPLMILNIVTYVLVTPVGAFSLYLVLTGMIRAVSWWIDDAFGDPLVTGVDAVVRRTVATTRTKSSARTRLEAEGAEEPDRRYTGSWAGLTDADFVIVAARRKPDWRAGTVVITPDGWFKLGEPFDRPTPNGLRTVYPLTAQTDLTVLRKGVSYELPPLRRSPGEG
jgi:hypothetical protein